MTQTPTDRPVVYPETDGRPMPDGEYQSVTWRYLVEALTRMRHRSTIARVVRCPLLPSVMDAVVI